MTAKKERVSLTCAVCGEAYSVKPYRAETSKYCSKACFAKRNPPPVFTCQQCGKEFVSYAYDRKAKFCSRPCVHLWRSLHLRGVRAPAWKGGLSLRRERARAGGKLAAWRKAVFQRDNYTCQGCGATKDLHAHHHQSFSRYPLLRYEVSNGITLCIDCHGRLHGKNFRPVSQKHVPFCVDCGRKTRGRSRYCKGCAVRRGHQAKKGKPA